MYLVRERVFVCVILESLTECRASEREDCVFRESYKNKCGWCR